MVFDLVPLLVLVLVLVYILAQIDDSCQRLRLLTNETRAATLDAAATFHSAAAARSSPLHRRQLSQNAVRFFSYENHVLLP